MIIAVDFDGTIVEHKYPEIGNEIPFATDTLKMLIKDHHRVILWSVREGKLLEDAVKRYRTLRVGICIAKAGNFYDAVAFKHRHNSWNFSVVYVTLQSRAHVI